MVKNSDGFRNLTSDKQQSCIAQVLKNGVMDQVLNNMEQLGDRKDQQDFLIKTMIFAQGKNIKLAKSTVAKINILRGQLQSVSVPSVLSSPAAGKSEHSTKQSFFAKFKNKMLSSKKDKESELGTKDKREKEAEKPSETPPSNSNS